MYLAKPGDKITFRVKTDSTARHQWQVNKKVDKAATGNSLTWTVPNEKDIWEIHLKITGRFGETHHEWVVSTLPKKEAPDFFDYFADKKLCNRTETDPWGRPLPEWIVTREYGEIDVSKCYLQPPAESILDNEGNAKGVIYYPWKHPYNTWKLRYMAPNGPHVANGGWTHFRYSFLHFPGSGHKPFMYLRETSEAHGYFGSGAHHFDHDKAIRNTRGRWYNAAIVQTKNNDFACYREGKKEFSGNDPRGKTCTGISLRMYSYRPDLCPNSKINVDCLEIWKGIEYHEEQKNPRMRVGAGCLCRSAH
jgi:hypothetical protein